jgi:L-2-hydroxycarboxylate dehydrogenase (NAD+)
MKMTISELEHFVTDVILREFELEDALRMKDLIVYAELAGKKSHGIIRLLEGKYGVFVDTQRQGVSPKFIRKTNVSSLIEGNGNPGMLVGQYAMEEVIRIAQEYGMGIVGTRNSCGTSGAMGYYVEQIAQKKLIGVSMAHCFPLIAPFQSKDALFGTNPVALSIPHKPDPLVIDISPAAITYGGIAKHKEADHPLPSDVAIDREGNVTTDPDEAFDGALLPFADSYKSSGIAMMVELLAGMWTGADFCGPQRTKNWGNLFLAFSPDLLSDVQTVEKDVEAFIRKMKNSKTRDGKEMRIPGEHSQMLRRQAIEKNEVEVDGEMVEKIKQQK